ncbi:MAG TPA: PKD domain-containing protein, partial [Actinopolymorphaceae bacterium]
MSKRGGGLAFAFLILVGSLLIPVPMAQAAETVHDKVVSAVPASNTPHVLDGRVLTVIEAGDLMILGGRFSQVSSPDGGTVYERRNIVAFDKETGRIDTSFAPVADGDVNSLILAPDGESVYVGGLFETIDGQGPRALARLELDDGSRTPGFAPPTLNGRIKDMKLADGRLWIGGTFGYVGERIRPLLATLDADTGAYDPYMDLTIAEPREEDQYAQVLKFDISPDGDRLIAIGNFTLIEEETHWQVGMLDLTGDTAAVADWSTDFFTTRCSRSFDSYMRDVDFSPDGEYFSIVTTGAYSGGPPGACDTSTRFETYATGQAIEPTWVEYTGGDTTLSVTVSGPAVYTGGHFRWQNNPWRGDDPGRGAVDRPGLAALSPVNGVPHTWNPTRTLGVGVFDLLATEDGLWVASDTDRIGDWLYRGRIAFFPLEGGTEVPEPYTGELPGEIYVAPAGLTSTLRRRDFDGSVLGAPSDVDTGDIDWEDTRGAFMLSGTLYTGHSDGDFTRRTYDGSAFGPPTVIDVADRLVVDTTWHSDIRYATGMFFDNGRIYYTRSNSDQLLFRNFNPESDIVDPRRTVAADEIEDLDWSQVRGMILVGDDLYFGYESLLGLQTSLRRVSFENGQVTGPVEVLDTEADWDNQAMFLFAGAPNRTPQADFSVSCSELTCDVDASASTDPDGDVESYAWDFGDGDTGSGVTASHTYADAGTYPITLTVTDDRGGTAQTTQAVEVDLNQGVRFVGVDEQNGNRDSFGVTVPESVNAGDRMLLFLTLNATDRTIADPTGGGWTLLGQESTRSAVTLVWQKEATAADAGSTVTVGLSAYTKGALTVAAYRGAGGTDVVVRDWESAPETSTTSTHTTPSLPGIPGAWLVSYWGEKSSGTTTWSEPAGQTRR